MLSKKLLVAAIATVVSMFLTGILGCSNSDSPSKEAAESKASPPQANSFGIPIVAMNGKKLSQDDIDAAKLAFEQWKVAKIGDSFYVCHINKNSQFQIYEFRRPILKIEHYPTTEADQLNGIERRVSVALIASAHRGYNQNIRNKWSSWTDEAYLFGETLKRMRGDWYCADRPDSTWSYKQLAKAEIPG